VRQVHFWNRLHHHVKESLEPLPRRAESTDIHCVRHLGGPRRPARHDAIDGTGWAREPIDRQPPKASGRIFCMAMYHAGHPNGAYEIANRVQVFDPPGAISWERGYDPGRWQPPVLGLDLALRPGSARPARNGGHALLRLIGGTRGRAFNRAPVPTLPRIIWIIR
jgi:hypothetical protein